MNKLKQEKAITLIALVVTIIVLLILAGVSISMLTGENGILSRGTQASQETIHANVYEQLQLKVADYFVEKNLGNTTQETLIEYLREEPNPILEAELGEGSGKYQINVKNLLGTEQKYGKGTATGSDTSTYKDVYMLERVETEEPKSGSIVNTKVASTKPIKIAESKQTINYTVKYYGTQKSPQNGKLLGNIGDTAEAKVDIATKIMEYLNDPNSRDANGKFVTNLGINEGDLKYIGDIIGFGYYRYKDGKIYKATYGPDENGNWIFTKVEPVNLDATIDPETETITTPFGTYKKPVEGEDSNEPTWLWFGETDESGNKIYYVVNKNEGKGYTYNSSGELVRVKKDDGGK